VYEVRGILAEDWVGAPGRLQIDLPTPDGREPADARHHDGVGTSQANLKAADSVA
jgi:hypothetical protein